MDGNQQLAVTFYAEKGQKIKGVTAHFLAGILDGLLWSMWTVQPTERNKLYLTAPFPRLTLYEKNFLPNFNAFFIKPLSFKSYSHYLN